MPRQRRVPRTSKPVQRGICHACWEPVQEAADGSYLCTACGAEQLALFAGAAIVKVDATAEAPPEDDAGGGRRIQRRSEPFPWPAPPATAEERVEACNGFLGLLHYYTEAEVEEALVACGMLDMKLGDAYQQARRPTAEHPFRRLARHIEAVRTLNKRRPS